MKPLLTLREEDIFPNTPPYIVDDTWEQRKTVKVILLNEQGLVALYGINFLQLPGGGVEEGESLDEAVKRECLEEVGCDVEVLKSIGYTMEYRLKIKRVQETHCFVARVVGDIHEPTTDQVDELLARSEWFTLQDALALLKKQFDQLLDRNYASQFNIRTHTVFIEEYLKTSE